MHQTNDFRINSTCSVSEQKSNYKKCCLKHERKIGVSFFVFILILVVLYSFKSTTALKIQKNGKNKRSVKPDQDTKINIEVIPGNKQMNHPTNIRFFKKGINNNMRRLHPREGWSLEPFDSKINKQLGPTRISKGKLRVWKPEEQSKLKNDLDLGSSMRLKGIYIKSKNKKDETENQLNGKYYYSKEINNLMQNNIKGGEEKEKLSLKSHGAPFRLPSKESLSQKKNMQENLYLDEIFEKQPITVYLKFYPMKDQHDLKRKLKQNSENKFFTSGVSYSLNVEKIILPRDKRNKMMMKLNLYPKESKSSTLRRIHRSEAERKSFGWLFKKKKKNTSKECFSIRVNPYGKCVTASWKNEKGEWIHADRVEVKNLEKCWH